VTEETLGISRLGLEQRPEEAEKGRAKLPQAENIRK